MMSQTTESFTAEDFIKLKMISSPKISPDGKTSAFVITAVDDTTNSYSSNIWTIPVDGSQPAKLFTTGEKDSSPKWSPDGKWLAFLSSREDKNKPPEQKSGPQLYIISAHGGEARKITSFPNGILDYEWHPNKLQFLILASVTEEEINLITKENTVSDQRPSFILSPAEAKAYDARKTAVKELENDPRLINRSYYRELNFYHNRRENKLFISEFFEDLSIKPKRPQMLTLDQRFYSIGSWSADGQYIFTYSPVGGDPANSLDDEILAIEATTCKQVVLGVLRNINGKILPHTNKTHILVSALGIAGSDVYHNAQIFSIPIDGSKNLENLTQHFDFNIDHLEWKNDTATLVGLTPARAEISIREFNISKSPTQMKILVDGQRNINNYDISKDGSWIVFEVSNADNISDLYSIHLPTGKERRLTNINAEFNHTHKVAKLISQEIATPENGHIQCWLMLPANHDGKTKLPVILEIHGGPAAMWSPHEKTMWLEFNYLVSKGFAVVFSNPRGSDGYGYEFRHAVHKRWGDLAANDLLASLDYFLTTYSFLDSSRIGVTGGSYGGYMTAWLVGHYNRFKAAVSQRGVYDYQSLALSSDIPRWMEEQQGLIWEDHDFYWKESPISTAPNIQAPLLIIHSDNDFRVPVSTSEQLFWALKRLGKTVELIRYPREGHELSRSGEPRHRIDRLNRIADWFIKYCL